MATIPVVVDEVENENENHFGRVCWRDDEAEPWKSVTAYALKPIWELRENLSEAIKSGHVRHNFYKIDRGKPLVREVIFHGPNYGFQESDMSKSAQAISKAVAEIKKGGKAAKAEERKALAAAKQEAREKKAAEAKAHKEASKAKKMEARTAAKEAKAAKKATGTGQKKVGIVSTITSIVTDGGGLTASEIHGKLCKAFPDRNPEGMMNTIRGTFAGMTKDGTLVVVKPEGAREKLYSVKGGKVNARATAKEPVAPKAKAEKKSKTARKVKAGEVGTAVDLTDAPSPEQFGSPEAAGEGVASDF